MQPEEWVLPLLSLSSCFLSVGLRCNSNSQKMSFTIRICIVSLLCYGIHRDACMHDIGYNRFRSTLSSPVLNIEIMILEIKISQVSQHGKFTAMVATLSDKSGPTHGLIMRHTFLHFWYWAHACKQLKNPNNKRTGIKSIRKPLFETLQIVPLFIGHTYRPHVD